MNTLVGKCKYCGAEQTVIAENQKEADALVARSCDCPGAGIEIKKGHLHDLLNEIAGELAPEQGFDAVSPEVFDIIAGIGDAVVEGRFAAASVNVDGTIIRIANDGKKVKANRKFTHNRGGVIE